jgi:hypothetical protein
MTRRLTTILLLLIFGVLPATAHAYNIASLMCQALGQDEENCCTAEGECRMDMSQMSHVQGEEGSNNLCPCDISEAKYPTGTITSAPTFPALPAQGDALKLSAMTASENLQATHFSISTSHHKSNKTYLINTCFRL